MLDRAISGTARMAALIDDVLAYAGSAATPSDDVDLDRRPPRRAAPTSASRWRGSPSRPASCPSSPATRPSCARCCRTSSTTRPSSPSPDVRPGEHRRSPCAAGWRIEITDNGRGVPDDRARAVFEPFTRADVSVDGSGIGLATCRRIVEAHGGRIGWSRPPVAAPRRGSSCLPEPSPAEAPWFQALAGARTSTSGGHPRWLRCECALAREPRNLVRREAALVSRPAGARTSTSGDHLAG